MTDEQVTKFNRELARIKRIGGAGDEMPIPELSGNLDKLEIQIVSTSKYTGDLLNDALMHEEMRISREVMSQIERYAREVVEKMHRDHPTLHAQFDVNEDYAGAWKPYVAKEDE